MKRTRKWAFVAQEATRLSGLGLSQGAIAARLGVNKSTVSRWIKSGRISEAPEGRESVAVEVGKSPAEWASAVRADYSLDLTDDRLVTLAEAALTTALDTNEKATVRMLATGKFQSVIRQLALTSRTAHSEPATPTEPRPTTREPRAATGTDPRRVLMAIK